MVGKGRIKNLILNRRDKTMKKNTKKQSSDSLNKAKFKFKPEEMQFLMNELLYKTEKIILGQKIVEVKNKKVDK